MTASISGVSLPVHETLLLDDPVRLLTGDTSMKPMLSPVNHCGKDGGDEGKTWLLCRDPRAQITTLDNLDLSSSSTVHSSVRFREQGSSLFLHTTQSH